MFGYHYVMTWEGKCLAAMSQDTCLKR